MIIYFVHESAIQARLNGDNSTLFHATSGDLLEQLGDLSGIILYKISGLLHVISSARWPQGTWTSHIVLRGLRVTIPRDQGRSCKASQKSCNITFTGFYWSHGAGPDLLRERTKHRNEYWKVQILGVSSQRLTTTVGVNPVNSIINVLQKSVGRLKILCRQMTFSFNKF